MRNRPLIIALIVFGVLALGLTVMSMFNSGGTNTPAPPTEVAANVAAPTPTPVPTSFVVATRRIPPRTIITANMLTIAQPTDGAVGGFTRKEDVVGKLSNLAEIKPNQTLLPSDVTLPLERRIPANFTVPVGLRAVAIYVDPIQTAAGLIDIGDHVDVIATHKLTPKLQDTDQYKQVVVGADAYTTGRTIGQDLVVLAVDRSIQEPPVAATPTPASGAPVAPGAPGTAPAPAPTPTPTPNAPLKTRVILAASPAVAERLVAAQDSGNLHVTIRDPNTAEQYPVSEAREYPSRIVNVPKKATILDKPSEKEQANSLKMIKSIFGGGNNQAAPQPNLPPVGTQVPPAGIPGGSSGGLLPSGGTSGADVTVIRGTDKKNVTVPSG